MHVSRIFLPGPITSPGTSRDVETVNIEFFLEREIAGSNRGKSCSEGVACNENPAIFARLVVQSSYGLHDRFPLPHARDPLNEALDATK